MIGKLETVPALSATDLLAAPVAAALRDPSILVAPIDPTLADTAEFCAAYDVGLEESANCVVVAGKRDGEVRYAACVILATTRADVNGVVRRRLDVRKASFAPMDDAVSLTGMEYGGITPSASPPAGRSSSTPASSTCRGSSSAAACAAARSCCPARPSPASPPPRSFPTWRGSSALTSLYVVARETVASRTWRCSRLRIAVPPRTRRGLIAVASPIR